MGGGARAEGAAPFPQSAFRFLSQFSVLSVSFPFSQSLTESPSPYIYARAREGARMARAESAEIGSETEKMGQWSTFFGGLYPRR